MRCLNCDVALEPRARSCHACGFATGRECERCGFVSLSNSTYCGGCGQNLSAVQGPELRQLTVMFCDLVSSTALSERLAPEDLRELLRSYQRTVAQVIHQADGYIAQYLGDGILAYFGFPLAHEGAARQAVMAGLGIPEACRNLASHATNLEFALKVRVGIHTGSALVATMGDAAQAAQLAVGETPNIAARLQSMAGENQVIVSGATRALVEGQFVFEDLGEHSLKGLSRSLAVHRVVSIAHASPGSWRSARGQLSPLVGRESELTKLQEAWRRVGTGTGPTTVLLRGEAGVGKSRLLSELRTSIQPPQLLEAYCSPNHVATAFYPLRPLLGQMLGKNEAGATAALADMARRRGETHAQIVAELLDIPGWGNFPVTDPRKRRQARLQVFSQALADFSTETPTLLVVEDLHWLDASTLELLTTWKASSAPGKVLLLLTARPDAELRLGDGVEQIDLAPLGDAEAHALLRSIFSSSGLSEPVARAVLERSAGVPLYLEEIGKTVRNSTASAGEADALHPELSQVPATLQESLLARLDQLGQARALAQLMAIIGRSVPLAWLAGVSAASEVVLQAQLSQLVDAEIIDREPGSEERYSFRHALIQEIAVGSLTRPAREEHHRRIADVLTTEFKDVAEREPALVGHHYAEAGQYSEAVACYGRAAQAAMLASAFQEAVVVMTTALALLARCPESPARDALEIELRRVHGLALILTRGYSASEVEQTYSRARELCERSGTVPLPVLYGVYSYHLVRGDARAVNRLVPLFEKLLPDNIDPVVASSQTPEQLSDAELVARAVLGVGAFFKGEYDEARRQCSAAHARVDEQHLGEQHERLMRQYGFDGVLTSALWIVWSDALQGRMKEAESGFNRVLTLARESGHPYLEAQACAYLAALARELEDPTRAQELAARTLALSTEHGLVFWLAFGLCVGGWVSVESGNAAAGVAQIQQGLGILDGIGSLVNLGYFQSFLIQAHLQAGSIDAGLELVGRALETVRESIGRNYEAELLRLKGALLLAHGDGARAGDHFRAALATARLQQAGLLELKAANTLASQLLSQGDLVTAKTVLSGSAGEMLNLESGKELERARSILSQIQGASGSVISDQTLS